LDKALLLNAQDKILVQISYQRDQLQGKYHGEIHEGKILVAVGLGIGNQELGIWNWWNGRFNRPAVFAPNP
jgi:hypothetical protein